VKNDLLSLNDLVSKINADLDALLQNQTMPESSKLQYYQNVLDEIEKHLPFY